MTRKQNVSFTQNALDEIRKAEKKTHRIIKNAKEKKAYSIVQRAHKDAGDIKEKHLSESRAKAEILKSGIIEKASDDAAKIQQEARNEIRSLKKSTEGILAEAVKKTKNKILEIIEKESW